MGYSLGWNNPLILILTIDPNFLGHPSTKYDSRHQKWKLFFKRRTQQVRERQKQPNFHVIFDCRPSRLPGRCGARASLEPCVFYPAIICNTSAATVFRWTRELNIAGKIFLDAHWSFFFKPNPKKLVDFSKKNKHSRGGTFSFIGRNRALQLPQHQQIVRIGEEMRSWAWGSCQKSNFSGFIPATLR